MSATSTAARAAFSADLDRWFPLLSPPGAARLCLLCFPFAGGGPAFFYPWMRSLPPDIAVRALHLPGRATRIVEPAVTDLRTLVPRLMAALLPLSHLPLVFFGHSNGALIAYELARAAGDRLDLRQLVLSSKAAPQVTAEELVRHRLSDGELIAELRRFGGMPEELLGNPEFMQVMLPTIRADFQLSETHIFEESQPLAVAAQLWWGERDTLVKPADVRRWQELLARPASLHGFEGGHFYLQQTARVLPHLRAVIEACLP
jgi:medium-chain acyl-[acyl-carrier-protein] hydrolase